LITFDLTCKLPFMLKRNPVYEAIRKGKYFEIWYEPMFDEPRRVVAMTNMVNIIKATGGKNLIVSSRATDGNTHRTPYDAAALLISLGLEKNKALGTMTENCQKVINNGQHRLYLKGAIQEIPRAIGTKLSKRIEKHRESIKKIQKKLEKDKCKPI
jgi:RNase P/RNase MRP subunit p30